MNTVITPARSPARRGLLLCILGLFCVTGSFFLLPLYAILAGFGGGTPTAWEFAMEGINNMLAQGITPGFLLGVSLPFIPLVAAFAMSLLGLAVFLTAKPLFLRLFMGAWVLGSIPIILWGALLIFLRVGYLGGVVGFGLFMAGYLSLRSYVTSVRDSGGRPS